MRPHAPLTDEERKAVRWWWCAMPSAVLVVVVALLAADRFVQAFSSTDVRVVERSTR
jgi:hypothetical protein